MTTEIHATLKRIASTLAAVESDDQPGLFDGYVGVALFHAYHAEITGDDAALERVHALLVRGVSALSDPRTPRSLVSGLAGIAWCLVHLAQRGLVELDDGVLAELDRVLFAELRAAVAARRTDFIHDGLGAMLYAIERLPDPSARTALEGAIAHLDAGMPGPWNLGLAHGLPAVLALLGSCLERGVDSFVAADRRVATRDVIDRGLARLRAARQVGGESLYPSEIDDTNQPVGKLSSRLGWCYGDLGIGLVLLQLGRRMNDRSLLAEARAIINVTCMRDVESAHIRDAGLCHGSMGLSHMYRRAARATDNPLWAASADAWLADTLRREGTEGYASHTTNGPVVHRDVLRGLAGVGLGLVAAIDPELTDWDHCLLLA